MKRSGSGLKEKREKDELSVGKGEDKGVIMHGGGVMSGLGERG